MVYARTQASRRLYREKRRHRKQLQSRNSYGAKIGILLPWQAFWIRTSPIKSPCWAETTLCGLPTTCGTRQRMSAPTGASLIQHMPFADNLFGCSFPAHAHDALQPAMRRWLDICAESIFAFRFAALSVGRVEDGQLFCRYHGWGFKGGQEGRCSCNPQAVGPEAEATVLNSSRSRLQTHPSQVDSIPAHKSSCMCRPGARFRPQI